MSAERSRIADVAAVLEVVASLDRELRSSGSAPFETRRLSRSQLAVLFLLARADEPVPANRLASALGVTAGAVTQTVDALKAEGLVQSAVHPSDARSRLIGLTPAAEREVAGFERQLAERMLPRFDRLDDEDLGTLARLLTRLRTDLSGARPDPA